MKKFPLLISFYTSDSLYHLHAHHLKGSCNKFDIEHQIEGIDSWGSWELNCSYKPFFILEKLKQFQSPVLWVDIDAVFIQLPTILDIFDQDVSVFVDESLPWDHPSKVRSGAVYVNYTPRAIKLLTKWIKECSRQLINPKREEEFWDQMALRDVIKNHPDYGSLPLSYVHIADHPFDTKKCSNPTIIHIQGSRSSKNYEKS